MHVVKRDLKALAPILFLLGAAIGWQSLSPQLLQGGLWMTIAGASLWFTYRASRRPKQPIPVAWLPLVGFLIWQMLRSYGASPAQPAVYSLKLTTGSLLAFLIIYDSLDAGITRTHWENAVLLLAGVFCVLELTLAAVWQVRWAAIAGTFLSLPPVGYRATGLLLQHPNVLSGFINLTIPLALLRLMEGTSWVRRILWGIALGVFGATQFLTSSRGGWLSAAVGAAVTVGLVLLIRRRGLPSSNPNPSWHWRPSRAMVFGILLGAALLIPLGWFALRQLSRVGHQPLSNARAVVWTTGWKIFSSQPIVGTGPGAYPVLSPGITTTPPGYDANHAHDLWLQVAAEEGLIGEILLLAALGLILLPGWRALKTAEANDASIAAYLGVAASILAHHVVDYMFGVVLYSLAVVCLLAIYLHTFKGRTISLNRWTWLAGGMALVGIFAASGVWLGRGNRLYWDGVQDALRGDWHSATVNLCLARQTVPDNSLFAYQCGLAADFTQPPLTSEAQAAFSASAKLPPTWAPKSANLGAAALANGNGNLALESLEEATTEAPRSWIFWINLARARACQNDRPGAVRAFEQALRTNPWLLGPSQSVPLWLEGFQPVLRLDRNLKGASFYRWWALEAQAHGNQTMALVNVNLGLNAFPGDPSLYAARAELRQPTDSDAAHIDLETALFIAPTDPYVLEVATELADAWGNETDANDYAVRWSQTMMETHYSEKYFYSVYHTFFLPVDLDPGLLRVTPSSNLVGRLKAIIASDEMASSLSKQERRAVEFAIDNGSMLGACP
ncbi:MAG: O-antigen ligase family protein [Anaerolineales bacterium]